MCRLNACSFNSVFLDFTHPHVRPTSPWLSKNGCPCPYPRQHTIGRKPCVEISSSEVKVLTTYWFQGNREIHPHIVLGHGPGPHDVHVAPVSNTAHPSFRPHMSVRNVHLSHVTVDQSDLGRPSRHSQLRNMSIGINNVHFINQCLSPVQLLFSHLISDLYIYR